MKTAKYVMAHTIALVSFPPDAGHVLRPRRVAGTILEHGHTIEYYLPQEYEKYLERYDFQFLSLDAIMNI